MAAINLDWTLTIQRNGPSFADEVSSKKQHQGESSQVTQTRKERVGYPCYDRPKE
ncbi:unnamed protein product [Dovyalis caffra]|uniref:Uncharacterized protein n=1 Tax=Dovyalis caffra TaxID=77055 RepID=A0AAV1SBM1_9ROSI|nr:unnamed protein product [Dovyalis caffra]